MTRLVNENDEERLRRLQLAKLEREESNRRLMQVFAALIFVGMVVYVIVHG